MSKQLSINELEKLWDDFDRPKAGDVFRHYKGDLYEIVSTGFLEDAETPCVVYKSKEKGLVWVRTAKNFFEEVEYKGSIQPRFEKEA